MIFFEEPEKTYVFILHLAQSSEDVKETWKTESSRSTGRRAARGLDLIFNVHKARGHAVSAAQPPVKPTDPRS